MLDEGFRKRVGQLAAMEETTLDRATCEQIVARVGTEGPKLVRAARRRQVALYALGPALAAAAGFAVWGGHRAADSVARWVHQGEQGTQTASGGKRANATVSGGRACDHRSVPRSAERGFFAGARGPELDLGEIAQAKAEPSTEVRLSESSACRTVLSLASGTVFVHAKDLGGGELHVVAKDGEVIVHGTMFAVTQTPDSFVVEVTEGRVAVRDRTGEHSVGAGERLFLSAVGLGQGPLPPERGELLRERLGVSSVLGFDALRPATGDTPQASPAPRATSGAARGAEAKTAQIPVPSVDLTEPQEAPAAAAPESPLAEAERARKAGEFARARELYLSAAQGQGPSAEAAWVALARMELSLGHSSAALSATKQRQARFGQGSLAPEALWIDVRAYRQVGDVARARALAIELGQRWPSSPQALAAQRWAAGSD